MKEMVLLVGIPGSGKSTWCTKNKQYFRVKNKDDIREMLEASLPKNIREREKEVDIIYKRKVKEGIDYLPGSFDGVVLDNTFLNPVQRDYFKQLAKDVGYSYREEWMTDSLNVDLCHHRNVNRPRVVPHLVIEQMAKKFIQQYFAHRDGFVLDNTKGRDTVIVDIDGTVADMTGVRKPFEWDKVDLDKPHSDIIELVYDLSRWHDIIFMSGRDEVCREKTEDWLLEYTELPDFKLFMRPQGDMRKDVEVKYELFRDHVNGKCKVKYVIDDRDQVIRLWRALGLRTLQVADGSF